MSGLTDSSDDLLSDRSFLLALVETSADCVKILDLQGRLLSMNPGGLRLLEIDDFRPFLGRSWARLWPKKGRTDAISALKAARLGGTGRFHGLCPTAKGTQRWWDVTVSPMLRADGRPGRLLAVSRDITDLKQAEAALSIRDERYRLAARATQDAIWEWDLASGIVEWCEGARELFGYRFDGNSGPIAWWHEAIHPDDCDRVMSSLESAVLEAANHWSSEYRFRRADGTYADVLDRGFMVRAEDGTVLRMLGAMQDRTEQKAAQEALRKSELRLRMALGAARMVAWELDSVTGLVTRSSNSHELLGIGSGPRQELLERVPEEDRAKLLDLVPHGSGRTESTVEFRYSGPDGREMHLECRSVQLSEGLSPGRAVGVCFDITERKAAEERATWAAHHDPLTGLPNRALLEARFEKALAQARRDGSQVHLLVLDVDAFKDVNDTLGHHAGDALLKELGRRIEAVVRENDTVARIGGDEFALLLTKPLNVQNATSIAGRILAEIQIPFEYAGRTLASRGSIGLAVFPDHAAETTDLMKAADLALYAAKAQGRNRAVVYSPAMGADIQRKVSVLAEVRDALRNGRFEPFYQPKVCLSSGKVVGFEALARWRHPTRGLLMPSVFGAAFDEPELAGGLLEQILGQVTADLRSWLAAGLECGTIAVNFSAPNFADPLLATRTLAAMAAAGVPCERLEIEVTETVFLGRGTEQVGATLDQFHKAGISIALDDFGTGFASLTHLKQFPVDRVKIDRSFIRGLERNPHDEAIVAAVIGLGKSLGLRVVAEGIETSVQARRLTELGCHEGQGYFYAKPMPGSGVPFYLGDRHAASQGRTDYSSLKISA